MENVELRNAIIRVLLESRSDEQVTYIADKIINFCLIEKTEPVAEVPCSVGLSDIDPYNLECLAMAIVNHVNERTGVDVKKRQETNDENFDHVIKQVKTFLKEIGR